ncbi:MAG TPA: ATP synthase F1 subunit delta [Phaeodactylibacter sp.]|nr:ATP synthase F1 subunit delta [Phaeodactylibacter sp.]
MSVTKLAGRYAKSLLDLAQEQGKLDTILGDVESFKEATNNRDFYLMLKSPIVNATKKRNIIKAIFEEGFDKMTMAFTDIILTKGREEYLPEICEEFINQYQGLKNITSATVISAAPLKPETLEKIKNKIRSEMTDGGTVEIETKVDASLLGGFVIKIGDKLYDASVASRLKKLKKELAN